MIETMEEKLTEQNIAFTSLTGQTKNRKKLLKHLIMMTILELDCSV